MEQNANSDRPTLGRLFAERRVYIRSDSSTRYITLSPLTQAGAAVALAGALGWSAFATTTFLTQAVDMHRAEMRLDTLREAYEARLAATENEQLRLEETLDQSEERADLISDRLSEKQKRLVDVVNELQEANLELSTLRGAFAGLHAEREAEQKRLTDLERRLAGLQYELAESRSAHEGMTDAMTVFTDTMRDVIAERDTASLLSASLAEKVEELRGEVARWEGRQERVLSQLEEAARTSMSALEKVFDRSNIDLERILRETKRDYSGSGGPFLPIANAAVDVEDQSDLRIAALMTDLERINLMRVAAERLPFGRPVKGARRTSGFGIRRDPFRRRASMHSGVDFAAPRGTPIYSTAHGVVSFAGRQSGYGIVVKIRHAFGFETVYAHLDRAHVKVGEHVERGDRIADMGSTGRSTGTHLHYEVRIENEPVNPARFIEAARDVL